MKNSILGLVSVVFIIMILIGYYKKNYISDDEPKSTKMIKPVSTQSFKQKPEDIGKFIRPMYIQSNGLDQIVVAIDFNDPFVKDTIVNMLENHIDTVNFIREPFMPDFYNKGYFTKIFYGDNIAKKLTEKLSNIDYTFLLQVHFNCDEIKDYGSYISCTVTIPYRLINKEGIIVLSKTGFSVRAGVTQADALKNAISLVVEKNIYPELSRYIN